MGFYEDKIFESMKLHEGEQKSPINQKNGLPFEHEETDHGSYDYYSLGYIDGVNCSATYYYKWLDKVNFYTVTQHHPYDDAEYYRARSADGINWKIILDGKVQNVFKSKPEDFKSVAKYIVSLSKNIKPRMVHN